MKKSKFLLLGSVASLASIPFVLERLNVVKPKKKINQSPTKIQVEIKTLEEKRNLKVTKNQVEIKTLKQTKNLRKKRNLKLINQSLVKH
nr:variable surface lipoprotein [Mycoplasmopsis bovis]